MTFDDKSIISRVIEIRTRFAGERGRSKFAKILGISASTYNYYEDNRVPPIELLVRMSEATGADLRWLITGESCTENKHSGVFGGLFDKLEYLLEQSPEMAEPVSAFIDLLIEKKGIEANIGIKKGIIAPKLAVSGEITEENAPKSERFGWIPVLGRTAAGVVHFWSEGELPWAQSTVTRLDDLVKKNTGRDIINSDCGKFSIDVKSRKIEGALDSVEANVIQVGGTANQIVEFVNCEKIKKVYSDCFALQIDGDSMSPRINDGDYLVLSPSVPAGQGQTAVVCLKKQIGVTCKLLRTTDKDVHLIPINERYETKVLPKEEVRWALAVLGHVRLGDRS